MSALVALTAGGGDGLLRATERGRPEILAEAARELEMHPADLARQQPLIHRNVTDRTVVHRASAAGSTGLAS